MLTKIKALCKKPLFWEAILAGVILLTFLISLIVLLVKSAPKPPAETTPTSAPTQAPTQPAKPTPPPVKGIDVSEHQEQIDWQQVKASGVEFVMIRVGWQGETQGDLFADDKAQTHYAGAKEAGLKVGAYIFSQAISAEEGKKNAEYLLEQTKNWEIDMYLTINWEDLEKPENRTTSVDARCLTDITKAFCQTISQAGKKPMIYFDTHLANTRLYLDELKDYPFWLAQYAAEMNFSHPITMWQHTCTGKVPGINGDVDIDWYYP